jgi:hypothetical protein
MCVIVRVCVCFVWVCGWVGVCGWVCLWLCVDVCVVGCVFEGGVCVRVCA